MQQTNIYAQNRLATDALRHHSRMKKWVPVTVSEMKVFIAVVMSMGLNGNADLESYWSTDDVLQITFYSKVMTRDRFLLILSNLHRSFEVIIVYFSIISLLSLTRCHCLVSVFTST